MLLNSQAIASVETIKVRLHGTCPSRSASSAATVTSTTSITAPVTASSTARFASLSAACSRIDSALDALNKGWSESRKMMAAASKPTMVPWRSPSHAVPAPPHAISSTTNMTKRGGATLWPSVRVILLLAMSAG
jgi:hypothetical protein